MDQKMTLEQFGALIKQKYPVYAKYSDTEIGQRVLTKYPVYQDRIATTQPQTQQPTEQPGFFSQLINDPYKTLIAKPATRFGQLLGTGIAYGADKILGTGDKYYNRALDVMQQDAQVPGIIPGTTVNIEGVKSGVAGVKQVAGEGLKSASYLVPAGNIVSASRPILSGAVSGAVGGGLYGTGQGLEDNKSTGDVIQEGLIGAGTGAVVGGAIAAIPSAVKLGKKILGGTTGAGESSINQASQGSQAFRDAMKGKVNPSDVVEQARSMVDDIKAGRSSKYAERLASIGENTNTHDISPVVTEMESQLKKFGIKTEGDTLNFSRSAIAKNGTARADIEGVVSTIRDWGSQPGDLTGVGLDTLKKQLDDFYSPSGRARAFVASVKKNLTNVLNKEIPGYSEMTSEYQKVINLLDDIKSATSIGGKAKDDTVFTKLTQAMRADKEFRLEMLAKLQDGSGDPDLMAKIAGINMSSWIPRGIIGRGIDAAGLMSIIGQAFNPQYIPLILSTSPRFVGEILSTIGVAKNKIVPLQKLITFLNTEAGQSVKRKIIQMISTSGANGATQVGSTNTDQYLKSLGL